MIVNFYFYFLIDNRVDNQYSFFFLKKKKIFFFLTEINHSTHASTLL
jgi:hypothetical protein